MLLVDRRSLVCGVGGGGQEGGNLGLDLRLLLHEKLESFVAVKRSLDPEVRHLGMLSFDVLEKLQCLLQFLEARSAVTSVASSALGSFHASKSIQKLKANGIYNIRMNDRWR